MPEYSDFTGVAEGTGAALRPFAGKPAPTVIEPTFKTEQDSSSGVGYREIRIGRRCQTATT